MKLQKGHEDLYRKVQVQIGDLKLSKGSGSDRRPETKQGIEGKIDRFGSGRVRVRDRVRVRYN